MDISITRIVKRKAPERNSRYGAVDIDALLVVDVESVLFSDAAAPMLLADLLGVSGYDGEARVMIPANAW